MNSAISQGFKPRLRGCRCECTRFGFLCANSGGAANRRFVDVVVKGRRRFEALRDFTVDGALEEVDRIARERKDAGEATGLANSRNASLDSGQWCKDGGLRNVPRG